MQESDTSSPRNCDLIPLGNFLYRYIKLLGLTQTIGSKGLDNQHIDANLLVTDIWFH